MRLFRRIWAWLQGPVFINRRLNKPGQWATWQPDDKGREANEEQSSRDPQRD